MVAASALGTGVFCVRVRTIFFPRNPYSQGYEMGQIYGLHGLAGRMIALIMVSISHFGFGGERPITKSMIFGWIGESRVYRLFLISPLPSRAVRAMGCQPVESEQRLPHRRARTKDARRNLEHCNTVREGY